MEYYRLPVVLLWSLSLASAAPRIAYRIETIAGSGKMGDGGPAAGAQFGSLQGIAADRAGNIYLSDTDYHRIRRISAAGVVSTFAGTGVAGYGGDGGPALSAQLNLPYGLAVDAAGYLYIADLGNQRVRRVSPEGTITTVAGNGQKGTKGDDGPAADAQLMSPRNLAVDAAGNLYIAEFEGHRVRRVTTGGRISTIAGTGVAGFSGDGFAARTAQLGFPAGLAVDRFGALHICDSQNSRVRKVVPGGGIVTVLGGAPGTSMLTPLALAVDSYGIIYVGDRSASVRQYSPQGAWTTTAGTGEPGYAGDNGPAPQSKLSAVHDLAFDAAGGLLIADGARVRRVNGQGVIATLAGDGYLRAIGDGGPAAAAALLRPSGLAADGRGNVWFADPGMHRVRRIDAGGQIATAAGTGIPGFNDAQPVAAVTPLDTPTGVAVSPAGDVLIADTSNQRIRGIGVDGRIRTVTGTGAASSGPEWVTPDRAPLRAPRGVCVDRAGVVFAVDSANHRVVRAPVNGLVSNAAGNGAAGDGGDGGLAPMAQLNLPSGCAVDAAGNLYIADTLNHRIRRVDPAGVISTAAGTGTAGFSGDGAAAAQARLYAPRAVAVDFDGNLYIADTGNHRIRKVAGGIIQTLAGRDAPGWSGDGGAAADAQLNAPEGVAVDGAGILYVADTGNSRIRKLTGEVLPPDPVILPPQITIANTASQRSGPLAPGEIVTIAGTALGPENGVNGSLQHGRVAGEPGSGGGGVLRRGSRPAALCAGRANHRASTLQRERATHHHYRSAL